MHERGELRVSPLAQRVLHPSSKDEGRQARAEAFQRVELLRQLYIRFEGEVPDAMSLLVGLEELTKATRDEIVRRAPLIQKHLTDAVRVLGGLELAEKKPEHSAPPKNVAGVSGGPTTSIELSAGGRRLSVPLNAEYIDLAIGLLTTLKTELAASGGLEGSDRVAADGDEEPETVADLEFGATDELDV